MPTRTDDDAAPDAVRAAAILSDGHAPVDDLLARVAERERARGRRVRGLLMTYASPEKSCTGEMTLVDIDTGEGYLVSQSLGSGSNACRADTQGFARASEVLRRAAQDGTELVIVNRFGSLEAEGGGFAAELLDIMSNGIPLLTAVGARHRDAWLAFSGGAPLLPPQEDAVARWIDGALEPARAA